MQKQAYPQAYYWLRQTNIWCFLIPDSQEWVCGAQPDATSEARAGLELSPTLVFDYPATNDLAAHLTSLLPAAPPQAAEPAVTPTQNATAASDAVVTIMKGARHVIVTLLS